MTMKRSVLALSGLSLLLCLPQCSDDPGYQYIKPHSTRTLSIAVGQSHIVHIDLAVPVEATSYVDIENGYTDFISIDPASLILKYKPSEARQKATLTGLKATPNKGRVPVTFKLRNTSEKLTLQVQIYQTITPDFGLPPDYGPLPDTGVLDTGTTPDTGAAADAGSTADK